MRASKRDTQITHFWSLWEKTRGGCFERTALKHVYYVKYVKYIARPGLMHETGCSGPVYWDDLEGWDGEGGGRRVQDGEHMYTHG